jgi:hypothetical protein
MLLSTLIALLLQLGLLQSPAQWDTLPQSEKDRLHQIVITDTVGA